MTRSRLSRIFLTLTVVVTLGSTAACSGDGDNSGKGDGDGGGGGAPKTADAGADQGAPALTPAQLAQAIIGDDEIKGFRFRAVPESELPEPGGAVAAECQAVSDIMLFSSRPAPKARIAKSGMSKALSAASVGLLAHTPADAEKVFAQIRSGVDKCRTFSNSQGGFSDLKNLPAPKAGDESVAYALQSMADGVNPTLAFTVVRSGSTVVVFYGMDAAGKGAAQVPAALVEAQVKKLEAVK